MIATSTRAPQATAPIRDALGREFRNLRISLTTRCNFACTYCVSTGGPPAAADADEAAGAILAVRDLVEMVRRIRTQTRVDAVRLTGGEPTLYPDLVELVRALRALGIERVDLTTNGFRLAPLAVDLARAGLSGVNISLDAVDEATFARASRRPGLKRVLAGIAAARAVLPVKLNATIERGVNENQVLAIFEFGRRHGLVVRYLELMRMGHLHATRELPGLVAEAEILARLGERYTFRALPREPGATARYFETPDGYRFGVIANESAPFCGDCDRLRLDSRGRLFGCLSENTGLPLAEVLHDDAALRATLGRALAQKRPDRFRGSALSMRDIGG